MDILPAHSELSSAPRLLDQVRGKIQLKHYSIRTEQAYLDWIKRFIRHFGKRHPHGVKGIELNYHTSRRRIKGSVSN